MLCRKRTGFEVEKKFLTGLLIGTHPKHHPPRKPLSSAWPAMLSWLALARCHFSPQHMQAYPGLIATSDIGSLVSQFFLYIIIIIIILLIIRVTKTNFKIYE
jgi:hypothetical protein